MKNVIKLWKMLPSSDDATKKWRCHLLMWYTQMQSFQIFSACVCIFFICIVIVISAIDAMCLSFLPFLALLEVFLELLNSYWLVTAWSLLLSCRCFSILIGDDDSWIFIGWLQFKILRRHIWTCEEYAF